MGRTIDIIIPEYNTKQELIVRALESVNRQRNLDFKKVGIIIISDGSKIKYKKSWFKQRFPKLNIDYYPKEINEGPGLTRQYGIDRSEADFITFLDSDDELYESENFSKVVNTLVVNDINILWTNFIEETKFEGKIYVAGHNPQQLHTLHGLFVKRKFIVDNNIRFSDQIKFQEDTYYADVLMYGYDSKYLDLYTYVWKYNDVSLVRNKNNIVNWNVKIIEDYIKSGELVYKKLEELDREIRHGQILSVIYGAYMILSSSDFDKYEDRRNKNLNELVKLYLSIKEKSYDTFSIEERKKIYDLQYETTSKTINNISYEPTFDEFIQKVCLDKDN